MQSNEKHFVVFIIGYRSELFLSIHMACFALHRNSQLWRMLPEEEEEEKGKMSRLLMAEIKTATKIFITHIYIYIGCRMERRK